VMNGGHGGGGSGGGSDSEHFSPCERCAKADVPCVYSCMLSPPLSSFSTPCTFPLTETPGLITDHSKAKE
jgi:hypothetical protein